jgi:hypothetical protein
MALGGVRLLAVDAALGIWLGTVIFFSFFVAPRAFEVLEDADAARFVNAVFPRYYNFGILLGAVIVVATAGDLPTTGSPLARPVPLAAAVGVGANAYARWYLVPKMEGAEGDEFWRYHTQSVLLNGLTLLAVAGGLVATHLG